MLFVPLQASFDLFKTKENRNISELHGRRALIMDDCGGPTPRWLSMAKGTFDSEGLPVNISREALPQNKTRRAFKESLFDTCREMFDDVSVRKDDYTVSH